MVLVCLTSFIAADDKAGAKKDEKKDEKKEEEKLDVSCSVVIADLGTVTETK